MADRGRGGRGFEADKGREWHRRPRGGAHINMLEGLRTLLKLGLDVEDDPVLVELGEDGGDLTLTECIVEHVVDRLGQDSQSRCGVAVDLQASLKPGGL